MRKTIRRYIAVLIIPTIVIWITGCLNLKPIQNPASNVRAVAQKNGKSPIIIVPGIMGSLLVNKKTGKKVWPKLNPKDNELALPISSDIKSNHDDVAATEVIGSASLAPFPTETNTYQNLVEILVRNGGYRLGNIDNPPPDGDNDTVYF